MYLEISVCRNLNKKKRKGNLKGIKYKLIRKLVFPKNPLIGFDLCTKFEYTLGIKNSLMKSDNIWST